PLYDFKDCLDGGSKKATRAAEALQEIYPGVDAQGFVMSVPMAGHPITDESKVKTEFEKLRELIDQHDAIFLLMDTRESRWLPTVMGKAAGKVVLNAALGFDTYVVMRHGLKASGSSVDEVEVGCYFCNDVVAPADSVKDATLDQQCTVTRPGIAPIASALLVELLVSVVQHPLRAHAPPPPASSNKPTNSSSSSSKLPANTAAKETQEGTVSTTAPSPLANYVHPLGQVPHQLRGFLANFQTLSINGQPYDCCSACSDGIVGRYKSGGWEFVKRAINESGWVEEISGLAEVQRRAAEAEKDVDWDEEDEDAGFEEEGEGEMI
ncbi:Autophagy protein 7, partial [Coniosporium uncinatum]